jgi:GT2 family glycosyltransferase
LSPKLSVLPFLLILLPVDFIVVVSLLIASAVGAMSGRMRSSIGKDKRALAGARATILILNWDGKHLLEECLPSVIRAVHRAGAGHQILVVDNGSTDGSVEFVRNRFPEVRVLPLDRNYGFIGGNNRGVEAVEMMPDEDFLAPLLAGFTDDSVFAVTSQIFFADRSRRREETGKTRARFEKGFFYLWHAEIATADNQAKTLPVFWAGGGSCAFDRKKYLEIGGFDTLYHPFYVEDVDLSYQAWKRGWKCLLAPASRVVHKHRATSSRKFTTSFVENTTRRNLYLFLWKNVTDPSMLFDHLRRLPKIHGAGMLQTNAWFEIQAYGRAVLKMPDVLFRRIRNCRHYRLDDSEVMTRSQR